MADGFKLDSEQPGFTAPQLPQGGGGQGLLNVLSSIGSGLLSGIGAGGLAASNLAAGIQAGRGNIGPAMFLMQRQQAQQEQERQQNLIGQLQTFADQADPQVKNLIQDQLKFGQADAAMKTAANASTFSAFKKGLETSRLSPELRSTLSNVYLTNPNKAADMLRSLEIVESQMGAARAKEQAKESVRESRKLINKVVKAFDDGILDGADPELHTKIAAIAAEEGKAISPEGLRQFIANPQIQSRVKPQPPGFFERATQSIINLFSPKQAPAAAAPAPVIPTPAAPAAPAARKRFNPQTGQLE